MSHTPPIRVNALAAKLSVDPSRLQPLIGTYLVPVDTDASSLNRLVIRPDAAAMKWIRNMLRPVVMRPLVRLQEVSDYTKRSLPELRELCLHADPDPIPVHLDPAFGELLSVHSVQRILNAIADEHAAKLAWRAGKPERDRIRARKHKDLTRFDRISLLLWMCGLETKRRSLGGYVLGYAEKVEQKIRRIAKMPEPQRGIQTVRLLCRYVDARVIAESLGELKTPRAMDRLQEELEKMSGGKVEDAMDITNEQSLQP